MLSDKIFRDMRYVQFDEVEHVQWFYDTETGSIYIVTDFSNGENSIYEYQESSPRYKEYFDRYLACVGEKYHVEIDISVNEKNQYMVEKMIKEKLGSDIYISKMNMERR